MKTLSGKSKTYETLKEEMINSYYTFENKKPNNVLSGQKISSQILIT